MSRAIRQQGFTLLEVLVASILLFIAIALASMSYRIGLKSELSAKNHVMKSVAVGFVREAIIEELRTDRDKNSGEGMWGASNYNWTVVKRHQKWSKTGLDIESNTQAEFGKQLVLYQIRIEISGELYDLSHVSWI